jgi:hemoglobin
MLHIALAIALQSAAAPPVGDDIPPYTISDANAGAEPYDGDRLFNAFNGKPGVDRVVADLIALSVADPRIADIFKGHDLGRLNRTLAEQVCYLLGGGCAYTGRDMKAVHTDMGLQTADLNALVENLQRAMDKEGVPFRAQNKLLAKLAPMKPDIVER